MIRNKKLLLPVIILLIGGFLFWRYQASQRVVIDIPQAQSYQEIVAQTEAEPVKQPVKKPDTKPAQNINTASNINEAAAEVSINLAVPFTVQAPLGHWVEPWEDACEEASVMMIDYYFQNKPLPPAEQIEIILAKMVDWQVKNWGSHEDLGVDQLADFIEENYQYKVEKVENLTVEKIIDYLKRGLPLIIPADGHKLDNPYFSGDGPDYHMLVVKGYKDGHFITNDPGTKRGADFIYSEENLMYSLADWDQKKSSATGPKRALAILPN